MNKCEECLAKSFFAEVFDLHWSGEEDCPFGCTMDEHGLPIPQSEKPEPKEGEA